MGVARTIYWNISGVWLMYVVFVIALGVFSHGVWKRIQYWRKGKPDDEHWGAWGARAWFLVRELFGQRRVRRDSFPGIFHSFIFYSFIVMAAATAAIFLDADFGIPIFNGNVYLLLSLGADVGGVLVLIGVSMAIWRRYLKKPASLNRRWDDAAALALLAVIVLTGFAIEAVRINFTGEAYPAFSPFGYALSFAFAPLGETAGLALHKSLWWFHLLLAMGLIAIIPYSKFFHLVSLPSNLFFANLSGNPALQRFDLEAAMAADDFDEAHFSVGVGTAGDFTWKQRLDHDACISCGRCENICPATQAGQPFSPMKLIAALRDYGHAAVAPTENRQSVGAMAAAEPVVGKALDEEFIWFCRTCRACMEVCPAMVEHVDQVMDLRRNEVMMQGRLPADARRSLKMLESLGNPFGPQSDRSDWIAKMGVPIVGPGEETDVLLWIGCCTTFDPTKQRIAEDLCRLLDLSGIRYGVLGNDERCCGDPARVLGDENLFQAKAKEQIALLQSRRFEVILASCPHCYHVLANEYRRFGAAFRVVHHSQYIHEMFWGGVFKPRHRLDRRITYHDPCYLGRYQKIYDSPREVLRAIPGVQVAEMASHKERSMCCGGGGGHFWMDLKAGARINNLRVKQAQESHSNVIATSCAYCMQMLKDSVGAMNLDGEIEVQDIATLALRSLTGYTNAPPPAGDFKDLAAKFQAPLSTS